jgi:hypothetical protein
MPKGMKSPEPQPEVFTSDSGSSLQVGRLARAGKLRKIGPRLYTTIMREDPASIVRRNLWKVVSELAPRTVVSHRTAMQNRPAEDGSVFVTGGYKRTIEVPGIVIRQFKGPGPLEGDMPFIGGLTLASEARFLLENLQVARAREGVARAMGRRAVEERLADVANVRSDNGLNAIRDLAKRIAPALGAERELAELDRIVGALLGTKEAKLAAPSAIAMAAGEPYDANRFRRFSALHAALRERPFEDRLDPETEGAPFHNIAFFDAYFSNYIEGTEFEVDEAVDIVFRGHIPENRPEDGRDVSGTYSVLGSYWDMCRTPGTFEEFERLLRERHAAILAGRPQKGPGRFKQVNNKAGGPPFVEPKLVAGTLKQGFEMYRSLVHPTARAMFIMFLVAEVHPFDDGNGRIARAMMNAELVAAGHRRILVPNVYRHEYVASLRRLTNHDDPTAFIRVMDHAQRFASMVDFSDFDAAEETLAVCNAFKDPADRVKLRLPVIAEHAIGRSNGM